ncbi:2-octaprenyl-6-methoxyphenyl hydroxylase [Thorsellia kenyensis]|uniref:2-octaprenyl-6-methoxyphenyl hydroxylase n=1 Tax=Thorsellia kenyensis TaxID=1549888 RepID=A0ABV6C8N3_9GAMM
MRVIIIGAGMNGATLALALTQAIGTQIDIQIVEPTLIDSAEHPGFDARSIAIAHGTAQKLRHLNLWQHFSSVATPINKVWVFEEAKHSKIEMKKEEYQIDALGYVVPLFDVGQSLYNEIKLKPNIKLWSGYEVNQIRRTPKEAYVTIKRMIQDTSIDKESHNELCADLLVIADGTYSQSVQNLKFQKQINDYKQSALIANIQSSRGHEGQAFEMLTDEGPIALLPLNDKTSSLVWCATHESIDAKMQLSDECFLAELQKRFGDDLGSLTHIGKRFRYELKRHVLEKPISHRVVAIGNAAQTLHPIAGQGFNLGMRDITHLCEVLKKTSENNGDIGAYSVLSSYLNKRERDRVNTLYFTHELVRWFSNDHLTKKIIRHLGLLVLSKSKCLKDKIAYQAMGWF